MNRGKKIRGKKKGGKWKNNEDGGNIQATLKLNGYNENGKNKAKKVWRVYTSASQEGGKMKFLRRRRHLVSEQNINPLKNGWNNRCDNHIFNLFGTGWRGRVYLGGWLQRWGALQWWGRERGSARGTPSSAPPHHSSSHRTGLHRQHVLVLLLLPLNQENHYICTGTVLKLGLTFVKGIAAVLWKFPGPSLLQGYDINNSTFRWSVFNIENFLWKTYQIALKIFFLQILVKFLPKIPPPKKKETKILKGTSRILKQENCTLWLQNNKISF
jgi:hypothetical protein